MIQLTDVWYRYGNHQILCGIQMQVRPGELVFLMGPSGAGKSTILRLVHMELLPDRGRVIVSDYDSDTITSGDIPMLRRKIGVVFQDFKLLEDRDVYDNVSYALFATGVSRRKIKKKVFQVLAEVGLSHKRYAMVPELSGGEKQRIALARALVNEPFVLLADEPTGNLDSENAAEIMKLLQRINRRGTAILMATHNEDLVQKVSGRIVRIREGKMTA